MHLIWVCVPCPLSEVARINVRSDNEPVKKKHYSSLQVPRCLLLGWMIAGILRELTSLIHSENEASLSVNPKCL